MEQNPELTPQTQDENLTPTPEETTPEVGTVESNDEVNEVVNGDEPEESIEGVQTETPEVEEEPVRDLSGLSTEELLQTLDEMITAEELPDVKDMKRLQRMINHIETPTDTTSDEEDKEMKDDEEDQGEERGSESSSTDHLMVQFINLKTRYQKLYAEVQERDKAEREENLAKKEMLLKRLEECLTSTQDHFKVRNEFRNIRDEWKSIGHVPEANRTDILGRYSKLLDSFYEQQKLNKEAQEYDFAHNRKEKERLIERAQALENEADVVKAFRELQGLHDLWKETGPVALEFRDSMWKDFKDASTIINKKHDDFFKQLHEQETENMEKKKAVVERLENLLIQLPTTREGWRTYESKMDQIRADWNAVGRIPRSAMNEMRSRFRIAVDEFYLQRRNFMKDLTEKITPKLERMRELVAEAESLKDSTEWKETADKLKAMQKEWSEVSQLGTRVGEAQRLWRSFRNACDVFFQKRTKEMKNRRVSREDNLVAKIAIVEQLEALVENRPDNTEEELARLQAEWNTFGPVPNEKKDDVLNRYFGSIRALNGETNRRPDRDRGPRHQSNDRGDRRNNNDRRGGNQPRERRAQPVNLDKDLSALSSTELNDETQNIRHNISRIEDELRQYENNILFFSASPNNPMVKHVQGKIDKLRGEIETLQGRIQEIKEEKKNPSSTPATETPIAEVEAPATEIETPATEVKTPIAEVETPATEIETPATETETPATETDTTVTDESAE